MHDDEGVHAQAVQCAALAQAIDGLKRLRAAGKSIRGDLLASVYHACDHFALDTETWRAAGVFRATYRNAVNAEQAAVAALHSAEKLNEPNVIEDAFDDLDDAARMRYRAAIQRLDDGRPDPTNGTWLIVESLSPVSLSLLRHEVGLAEPGSSRPAVQVLSPQEADARRALRFARAQKEREESGVTNAEDEELMRAADAVLNALASPNQPAKR